ncbi:unnamed protein product [Rangifer tarandus platyrhynchus]|uniref:Uncharacterized protein n=1 Tax=Rangifer tarandus platyrhynchus TaxID=3082113 RepID=A0ABN8ZG18_RANTA|nr:unnamed protein product [Rangifer tarandus platyrhynchus]
MRVDVKFWARCPTHRKLLIKVSGYSDSLMLLIQRPQTPSCEDAHHYRTHHASGEKRGCCFPLTFPLQKLHSLGTSTHLEGPHSEWCFPQLAIQWSPHRLK